MGKIGVKWVPRFGCVFPLVLPLAIKGKGGNPCGTDGETGGCAIRGKRERVYITPGGGHTGVLKGRRAATNSGGTTEFSGLSSLI